jgi:hypothetical protein
MNAVIEISITIQKSEMKHLDQHFFAKMIVAAYTKIGETTNNQLV